MYCCAYSHTAAVVFLAFPCPSLICDSGDDLHMYADMHVNTQTHTLHVDAHLACIMFSDMNQDMPICV